MKTTIIEPYVPSIALKDLRAGQTFRWANKADRQHEHVCIVLNVDDRERMVIKNLTTGDVYIRAPYGEQEDSVVNRLNITSIEATL